MGVIWSKSSSPDYEQILSDLTSRISNLEARIIELRNCERRWSVWIVSYGLLIYVLYVLYVFIYPRGRAILPYRPLIDAVTLLTGPLAVYYTRKLVVWAYGRRVVRLESSLCSFRAQQKLKVPAVEELKKMTSYYKTKGLVERFDVGLDGELGYLNNTSTSLPVISEAVSTPPQPSASLPPQSNSWPIMPNAASWEHPPVAPPPAPASQTWLDRLVDAIIGDDRNSRYALICQKCYAHNGLARPEEFDTIQYLCPSCHYLNQRVSKDEDERREESPPPGSTQSSPESMDTKKVKSTTQDSTPKQVRRRSGRRRGAQNSDLEP